jgi:hypothetical protein
VLGAIAAAAQRAVADLDDARIRALLLALQPQEQFDIRLRLPPDVQRQSDRPAWLQTLQDQESIVVHGNTIELTPFAVTVARRAICDGG